MTVVYEDLGDEAGEAVPIRRIRFSINGKKMVAEVEPRLLLSHLIRRGLGLTGTHMGCDTTNCGACTVLVDGRAIKSCTRLAGTRSRPSRGWPAPASCTPCRRGSSRSTGCSAAFAPPA